MDEDVRDKNWYKEEMRKHSITDILKNQSLRDYKSILLLLELAIEEKQYEHIAEILQFLPFVRYSELIIKTLEDNIIHLSDKDKALIINKIKDDNIKLKLLEKYKDTFIDKSYLYQIVSSLDDENLAKVFHAIKDENQKANIVEKIFALKSADGIDFYINCQIRSQEVSIAFLINLSQKLSVDNIGELFKNITDLNVKLSVLETIISKNSERTMEIYNAIANKDDEFFKSNIFFKIKLFSEEDQKVLETLLNNNSRLFLTFDFKLLDIKEIKNTKYFEVLTKNHYIQSCIIKMYQDNKKKFLILTKLLEYLDSQDLANILIVESVVEEINRNSYDDLIQDINLENFNENNLKTLMFIIMKNNTIYNGGKNSFHKNQFRDLTKGRTLIPSNFADLENYFTLYNKPFDNEFATTNDLNQLKRLIFNKHFGIEYFMAKDLIRQYSVSLNKIGDPELDFIKKIKYIFELESEEELKKYYLEETPSPLEYTFLDSKVKRVFNNNISNSLCKVNDSTLIKTVEYAGKEVKVYTPKDDFYIMAHSLVMWQHNPKPITNYNTYWNNKLKNGFSCSFISNQQPISLAIVQDVLIGFDSLGSDTIQLMANYDLISESENEEFTSEYSSTFMLSEDLIDYTRERHNELVLKRRELRNIKSPYHNMQPSYVIIYDTTPSNLVERSLKAATELNIPILFIDTKLISKRENEIITNLFNEFMTTLDASTFKKMLVRFCNSANTYRQNTEIQKQYFSLEKLTKYLDQIYNLITNNLEKNPSQAEKLINLLGQITLILSEEQSKNTKILDPDKYMELLLRNYSDQFSRFLERYKNNNLSSESNFKK